MTTAEIKEGQFKCDHCGGVFDKEWSDEDALAEMEENFGPGDHGPCDIVCDDCYEKCLPFALKSKEELDRQAEAKAAWDKLPPELQETLSDVMNERLEKILLYGTEETERG